MPSEQSPTIAFSSYSEEYSDASLVEVPEIVRHYAPFFKSVFSPEAFCQFQRYLSGLIISENKTVDGINRIFVIDTRNQSSLNRLLQESPCSVAQVNEARLKLLQSLPGTEMKQKGVLSVDDTLLSHYGQEFEKIASCLTPSRELVENLTKPSTNRLWTISRPWTRKCTVY